MSDMFELMQAAKKFEVCSPEATNSNSTWPKWVILKFRAGHTSV